jgi:hypothetical protein
LLWRTCSRVTTNTPIYSSEANQEVNPVTMSTLQKPGVLRKSGARHHKARTCPAAQWWNTTHTLCCCLPQAHKCKPVAAAAAACCAACAVCYSHVLCATAMCCVLQPCAVCYSHVLYVWPLRPQNCHRCYSNIRKTQAPNPTRCHRRRRCCCCLDELDDCHLCGVTPAQQRLWLDACVAALTVTKALCGEKGVGARAGNSNNR